MQQFVAGDIRLLKFVTGDMFLYSGDFGESSPALLYIISMHSSAPLYIIIMYKGAWQIMHLHRYTIIYTYLYYLLTYLIGQQHRSAASLQDLYSGAFK